MQTQTNYRVYWKPKNKKDLRGTSGRRLEYYSKHEAQRIADGLNKTPALQFTHHYIMHKNEEVRENEKI